MSETIERLVKTIKAREGSDIKSSYTSFLLSKGNDYCLNKLKEEIIELEDSILILAPFCDFLSFFNSIK